MEELIWGKKRKERKPVHSGVLKQVVARAGGKCERCGMRLVGLRYHIHHKNMNPADNRPSNLEVLCPNCHSKIGTHSRRRKEPSFENKFMREMEKLDEFAKKIS